MNKGRNKLNGCSARWVRMLGAVACAVLTGLAGASQTQGQVVINEVLGSTTGFDTEFIELYNTGVLQDITDWSIVLYDSDAGNIGDIDATYSLGVAELNSGNLTLDPNEFFLLANPEAASDYGLTSGDININLPANAIENSSYTIALLDDLGAVIDAIFVTDGGSGDTGNIAGDAAAFTSGGFPTVGPDGPFLPAGVARETDGGNTFDILDFTLATSGASGTPGTSNAGPVSTDIQFFDPDQAADVQIAANIDTTDPLNPTGEGVWDLTSTNWNDTTGQQVYDPSKAATFGDGFTGGDPDIAVAVEVNGAIAPTEMLFRATSVNVVG